MFVLSSLVSSKKAFFSQKILSAEIIFVRLFSLRFLSFHFISGKGEALVANGSEMSIRSWGNLFAMVNGSEMILRSLCNLFAM